MDIRVENIKCHGCAGSIRNGLSNLNGVKNVEVDIENGIVSIDTDETVDKGKIISKLHAMGYPEPGKGSGLTTATSYVSCMIGRVTS